MFSAELKKPALKFLKSIKDKTLLKRVGDYRILYFVDYSASKVYIEKIDKRSRVY